MKIGFSFFGIIKGPGGRTGSDRDYKHCWPELKRDLIDPFAEQEHQISIYFSGYHFNTDEEEKEFLDFVKPTKVVYSVFEDSNAFTSKNAAFDCFMDEDIDVVVFTRSDIHFSKIMAHQNLDFEKFNFLFREGFNTWEDRKFTTDNFYIIPKRMFSVVRDAMIECQGFHYSGSTDTHGLLNFLKLDESEIHFISDEIEHSDVNSFYTLCRNELPIGDPRFELIHPSVKTRFYDSESIKEKSIMPDISDYLNMQKSYYEIESLKWSLDNKDPVVGSYDHHNEWKDYEDYLFKDFDTSNLIALDYGCGPGRNLIKLKDKFARVDGVDIAKNNILKAKENLAHNNITNSQLFVCDGKSIPDEVNDNTYDVVFSVICLQHICCHSVRYSIMEHIYRVLKPGGHFCFQMGFGYRGLGANYHDNVTHASETNGGYDVEVKSEDELRKDLEKIGFKNFKADVRPTGPGDSHPAWIFVQVTK